MTIKLSDLKLSPSACATLRIAARACAPHDGAVTVERVFARLEYEHDNAPWAWSEDEPWLLERVRLDIEECALAITTAAAALLSKVEDWRAFDAFCDGLTLTPEARTLLDVINNEHSRHGIHGFDDATGRFSGICNTPRRLFWMLANRAASAREWLATAPRSPRSFATARELAALMEIDSVVGARCVELAGDFVIDDEPAPEVGAP